MEFGGLKVLMLSTDSNIFVSGSPVSLQMKELGELVDELHIVVLASSGVKELAIAKNVYAYPVNSFLEVFKARDAFNIGKKIIKEKKFVRGRSVIVVGGSLRCGDSALKLKNEFRIPLEVQLGEGSFLKKNTVDKLLKQADSIVVASQTSKAEIMEKFKIEGSKINVLPPYIDKERIEEDKPTFDLHARLGWHFILLCVAPLTPEKNLGLAIEVLSQVRKYYSDAGLVIVGSGPEENNLRNLAKKLGVESNVHFADLPEDIMSYYKTSNLFLQTSNFEEYGRALVEAGLVGLPVVTTNVGIAKELENGKDAYIAPVGDKEFIFKAVYDLIKDGNKREMLKASMKKTLEEKLVSKEEYMAAMQKNWEDASGKVELKYA